ncbi:MAG TPA: YciI family protein [Amnibacterium sp.]|jgi:hypothetical protein|nr:YciI family protein [Amnibacterium sp.]
MQYVMLVRVDPSLPVPEDGDVEPWVEEGARTGMRVEGGPIAEPEEARTVRVRDGRTVVSDGPFAEMREVVAGYDLLEADSLEQAADYATRHPVAAFGALEIRQVWADFVPDDPAAPAPEPTGSGQDFLFLHVPEPALLATATREQGDPTAWVRDAEARRVTLGGHRLRDEPQASAVVRRRGGETLIAHGPFAELGEQIAGIDLVRVRDAAEAIALAEAHPTARIGAIEVRALQRG